jgi:hypothetical protein
MAEQARRIEVDRADRALIGQAAQRRDQGRLCRAAAQGFRVRPGAGARRAGRRVASWQSPGPRVPSRCGHGPGRPPDKVRRGAGRGGRPRVSGPARRRPRRTGRGSSPGWKRCTGMASYMAGRDQGVAHRARQQLARASSASAATDQQAAVFGSSDKGGPTWLYRARRVAHRRSQPAHHDFADPVADHRRVAPSRRRRPSSPRIPGTCWAVTRAR